MKLYLHVDRSARLQTGDIIKNEPYCDEILLNAMGFIDPDFVAHLNRLARAGLSRHGYSYIIAGGGEIQKYAYFIELQYEYVRFKHFPELPSRFQSFFAFREYKNALRFAKKYGSGGKIFEISFDGKCFIGDMNLLKLDRDPAKQKEYAENYWNSRQYRTDSEYEPFWECVIDLPVEIKREMLVNPLDEGQ